MKADQNKRCKALVTGWLVGATACLACLYVPGLASAAGKESVRSTQAYLQADYAYTRAVARDAGASAAAITARAAMIAGECPSVLTFAPRDGAFGEVAQTIERSVWLANVDPVRAATLRFVDEIGHLRWADKKLTQLVRAVAAQERFAATVTPPAVCASVEAWKNSAYTTLPAAVGAFVSRLEAIEAAEGFSEESLEARIEHRLRRYANPHERRLAGAVKRLEGIAERRLDTAFAAARRKLEAALGASPL